MNAFLEIADRQISGPRKALARAAEKRREKTLAERDQQSQRWQTWQRQRREELLAGPHGDAARDLADFLDSMTPADTGELIERVRSGPWVNADADIRFAVLALIDSAIISLRERMGLPPFDDALPGAEPTTFLLIRGLLS